MQPVSTRAVQVLDYDPEWAILFSRLRDQLWALVSDLAMAIEHVGSTSVEGMAAKPVLDIDIVVPSLDMLPLITTRLEGAGYAHRGNLGIEGREAFEAPADKPRHHLYVCAQDSIALRNHLTLRDHLRLHPSDAAAYSALKKRLAEEFPQDIDSYVEGKSDFIISILTQYGSTTCYNCGASLRGTFCARCGQKVAPLNPSLHDFLHEFTHEMLHVDGRIFKSTRKLLLSPGFLTREQVAGRRASWISPIRLYLIFSIAYFAISTLASAREARVAGNADSDQEVMVALQRLGFESERALQVAIVDNLAHWWPRAMFVMVPLFAWLVSLVRRGRGRNYPQHLYFALHVHAAWFAAAAVVEIVELAIPSAMPRSLDVFLRLSLLLYGLVYATLAFRLAYGAPVGQAVARMTAILGVYSVVVVIASVAIALAVVFSRF